MQNLNTFCLPENREMISINICHDSDRPTIYRIRHQIYAEELGQHEINDHKELKDHLDHDNEYLIVKESDQIKGFVSITPPKNQTYSIDKYFSRVDVPCSFDNNLYEVRLLTVPQGSRGRLFASLLMYGAFRWIQNRGGKQIVAIGRKEVKKLYQKVGFKFTDLITQSGQVSYQLMIFNLDEAESHLKKHFPLLQKIKQISKWNLAFPFEAKSQPCFHGGAFFQAIGEQFDAVESRHEIVNADVLDAWFPPTPSIEELCENHLNWLLKTSPPTQGHGLKEVISKVRKIDPESILLGPGSSSLMFFAFPKLLNANSKVLLPDPTYGEYEHIFKNIAPCHLSRWILNEKNDFYMKPHEIIKLIQRDKPNLFVLVNPNNPTGQFLKRSEILSILRAIPKTTIFWIDEAYLDYIDPEESVENYVITFPNLIVCKSLSKVYALSGARAAYLCAHPNYVKTWEPMLPPWSIGTLTQMAAIKALQDPCYYKSRYLETINLREQLVNSLTETFPSWTIYPGCANFVLCKLPNNSLPAATIVERCQKDGVFLRDAGKTSSCLGSHHLRIAVKEISDQTRIIMALDTALQTKNTRRIPYVKQVFQ